MAATSAASPTTIAVLSRETAIHAFAGVQAWNEYDEAQKLWHVTVRRAGILSAPSIPPAKDPIELDVGPGSGGGPALAYVRCTDACRVVVSRLDGGEPQTVPGSERASAPTIWGRRVAWVRGSATVLTSMLDGRERRVLGGAPRRVCYTPLGGKPRRCERPQSPVVSQLKMHGSQLALVDSFALKESFGEVTEVRTESVTGTRQRLVALSDVGEAGQSWVGPSWAVGKLFFYKSCPEDPGGCNGTAGGAFAFDPARNAYLHAKRTVVLAGFAIDDDGRRAYEATTPAGGEPCGAPPCTVRLTDPLGSARRGHWCASRSCDRGRSQPAGLRLAPAVR